MQVVHDVELARSYCVDGEGEALATYERERGRVVSKAIDEPTTQGARLASRDATPADIKTLARAFADKLAPLMARGEAIDDAASFFLGGG